MPRREVAGRRVNDSSTCLADAEERPEDSSPGSRPRTARRAGEVGRGDPLLAGRGIVRGYVVTAVKLLRAQVA